MKKLPIAFIFLAGILFFACRKEDNPKIPDLARVPAVLVKLDATSDKFISPITPAGFKGKFTVDLLFPNEKPQSVDVVVMRNNDPLNVKVVKAAVSTFPTPVEVTGQQLITLFGQPITGGDSYTFGVNVNTTEGNTFVAFPTAGASAYSASATNAAINVLPGATTQVSFLMPCTYDPDMYQGDFIVVKDTWADTNPGDIIPFTKIDATHFSFIYPTAVNPIPITVTVDPATNTPSIALQTIGTAWVYDDDPPPPTVKTTPSAANLVDPCSKTISLNVTWTEGTGSYPRVFILKKK
jgi:hypothetical protein